MQRFENTRRVKHSAADMFALVADVERYPEFVPLCEGLTIKRRSENDGYEVLTASMIVGYKAIREHFTTRVTLKPQEQQILVNYIDGPFKMLDNRWKFLPRAGGGCDVKFFIEYEFKSFAFQILAGAVFERLFAKMSEAFEARADMIYKNKLMHS